MIILIAKFESPNNFPGGLSKEQFDVEGEIKNQFESIKKLYESKSNADKIDIEFIDEEIKYEDEQKVFDELEKRLSGYKFGLIVWGKYKSTGNESRISARIGASESLLESKNLSASLNDNDKKSINVINSKFTQFNSQVKGKYTDFAEYKLQEELAGKNLFLVLITLGFANVKSNNFEASEMFFNKAISLYKTGAKSLSIPYFGKVLIYQKQNKIDLSVKNYADSLSNYSKTNTKYDGFAATSYNNLAMICFLNPQKCTPKIFKNILGLDKNKYSYRTLARDKEHKNSSPFSMFFIDNEETNLSDGVIDLSEIFLNKSLDIYNSLKISNSTTLNNIGYLSLFKGNLENALKYFNKAIASDDKNFMAYSNRGVLRLFCYNQNDNLKDYQDAKKMISKNQLT